MKKDQYKIIKEMQRRRLEEQKSNEIFLKTKENFQKNFKSAS